jgi:recombinational DNA repair protein (RecF pathway)
MKRNIRTQAIVLKTYNVGESDRYCIVLSKDLGRLHVRANGARKTISTLGPYLLGMQCIELELYYSKGHYTVRSAYLLHSALHTTPSKALEPAIECCLALLPEEVPATKVYDVVYNCITNTQSAVIPALLQILHHLGYLPSIDDPSIIQACTQQEHQVLHALLSYAELSDQHISHAFSIRLLRWVIKKVEIETGKPLRSLQVQ